MPSSIISHRANNVQPSPTLAMDAKAKKMQAAGGDIINLGVGEPDFDTPSHIKDAAIQALHNGKTKYTPVQGIIELRQAISDKFARENQLNYRPEQVIVSNGAKQSFFNLVQAVINAFDEVIIPCPYWVSYPDIVRLAEGTPVFIEAGAKQHFKITPTQLELAITPKTKMIVLNSPSNPSGMVYSKEELTELAEVLLCHPNILIASDDMYEHILWTHYPFCNIVNVCPELQDRTVVINGLSKAYAMTGWRIGYAAGAQAIVDAMIKIQSQSTSNPNSVAQYAGVEALNGDQRCITEMVKIFKTRHDRVYNALQKMPRVTCLPSQGTFYSFPDISRALPYIDGGLSDDVQLADYLLTKAGVAVVPGTAFGSPGCIRLSFATSNEKLDDAMDRLAIVFGAA
ncbi:MAG: pyridoxal phosphate-dependent aminotransferase [Legionellales bacterium]|nr:pyridoxal phosphate-dependent aminotransferase [Legionellales bacterium]